MDLETSAPSTHGPRDLGSFNSWTQRPQLLQLMDLESSAPSTHGPRDLDSFNSWIWRPFLLHLSLSYQINTPPHLVVRTLSVLILVMYMSLHPETHLHLPNASIVKPVPFQLSITMSNPMCFSSIFFLPLLQCLSSLGRKWPKP